MPTTFRPCAPDQSWLFPPSPRDWLPEGHLAFFIADTVAALDLGAFYAPYEGDGRRNQPFDPQMMVTVLVYAYATGTFSSRRIARKLEEDVAYRVLAAGNFPAHRTIADFGSSTWHVRGAVCAGRADCARSGRGPARRAGGGWIEGESECEQAQGDELRTDAGRRAAVARADRGADGPGRGGDAAEDAAHGADVRGDEFPAELQRREERLAKIAAAKARLEARQAAEDRQKGRTPDDGRKGRGHKPFARDFGVPPDDAQDNFTDPESRIMKTSTASISATTARSPSMKRTQMIVATGLTNCAADNAELLPLIDRVEATLGGAPPEVLADAGYRAEATFQTLEARDITAYISLGHETRPAKAPNPAHVATQRMADRLTSEGGRARYRRRKAIVEPVIGWIKQVLGFRRFSLRGAAKARGEWNLVCLAVNLKRWHRIGIA